MTKAILHKISILQIISTAKYTLFLFKKIYILCDKTIELIVYLMQIYPITWSKT